MTESYQNLEEFLGSYFHQDWTSDASSSMEIVMKYLSEWPADEAKVTLRELGSLLATHDEEAVRSAVTKMGCYFEPSSEGCASFTGWLKAVEKEMHRVLDNGV